MSIAIIDLNDSAILGQHGEVSTVASGHALLTRQGVITGTEALQKTWLLPQQSHNQYWHQLNLSPLAGANGQARHHADLAYAQLQALYHNLNKPEQIIFALPGNTSADQLSILLGLVKALPFDALGLVDAAVAASSQLNLGSEVRGGEAPSGEALHIDIQLHTAVITRMAIGAEVSRIHANPYPDISLKGFYDNWAHFIADKFISEYRYDPLHTAHGEQQLRDLLPEWLNQLRSAPEIAVELSAKQGNFRLNILRKELIAASHQRWQRLADAVAREKQADAILLSHRVAELPGAEDYIQGSTTLTKDATIKACLENLERIAMRSDQLVFVTALPTYQPDLPEKPAETSLETADQQHLPTHVLYQHQAYLIGEALQLSLPDEPPYEATIETLAGNKPIPESMHDALILKLEDNKLCLSKPDGTAPQNYQGDANHLGIGDIITLGDETMTLIEVL